MLAFSLVLTFVLLFLLCSSKHLLSEVRCTRGSRLHADSLLLLAAYEMVKGYKTGLIAVQNHINHPQVQKLNYIDLYMRTRYWRNPQCETH